MPEVIAAKPNAARVIDMLMLAFAADPPNRWLFPDAHDYVRNFPKFVQGLGGAAFARRHRIHDVQLFRRDLVACPRCQPGRGGALERLIEEDVAPDKQAAIRRRDRRDGQLSSRRSRIGICRSSGSIRRGKGAGIGAALLRPIDARSRRGQAFAYLESTKPSAGH